MKTAPVKVVSSIGNRSGASNGSENTKPYSANRSRRAGCAATANGRDGWAACGTAGWPRGPVWRDRRRFTLQTFPHSRLDLRHHALERLGGVHLNDPARRREGEARPVFFRRHLEADDKIGRDELRQAE